MLNDLYRRLDEACPWLSRWLGGRLDVQLPAILLSLLTHAVLLALFGVLTYAATTDQRAEIRSNLVEADVDDFAVLDQTEIQELENTALVPSAAAAGPRIVPMIVETPPGLQPSEDGPALLPEPVTLASRMMLPTATRLEAAVAVRSTGAERVEDVEQAVDRIAIEIVRRLELGRTLVVWAFDASGSLQEERARLADYIGQVYTHVGQLDKRGLAEHDGLLTAVIAFGKERRELLGPSSDAEAIRKAIAAVPLDESGDENTFQAVVDIARRYGKFTHDGQNYSAMTVVVTDEVGDDEERLEPAIAAASAVNMPVYVLGSPALFGRVEGYMDYTEPKSGRTYRGLPVRQGPESVAVEMVKVPFWYDGPQYDLLDSGFGPWALSRLATTTGGIYFLARIGTAPITFDPAAMREYRPELASREAILNRVVNSPLRRAVVQAGEITLQDLPGQPPLSFPDASSDQFKEVMARNQEIVARIEYTVNEALVPINAAAEYRDREPSRRWRAHYDLIRGRLLAMKVRCFEYNWACAEMKRQLPRPFSNPEHNAWRLVPDDEVRSHRDAVKAAETARALLAQVVEDHPGTPWALLAKRERKDPLGFRWVEVTVPPERPRDGGGGNPDNNNRRNAPPPPPPPKL